MNSSEKAFEKENFILQMLDSGDCQQFSIPATYEEYCNELASYDEAIYLYRWLLEDAKEGRRYAEVCQLKKDIQRTKTHKRIYISRFKEYFIGEINAKEDAIA